jgi:hypothetical protein
MFPERKILCGTSFDDFMGCLPFHSNSNTLRRPLCSRSCSSFAKRTNASLHESISE